MQCKVPLLLLQASLLGLFSEAGFVCLDFQIHERQIENRRQQVVMHRRWVQAKFVYSHSKLPAHSSAIDQEADVQQCNTQRSDAQQANIQQATAQQADIQQASVHQAHTRQANTPGLVLLNCQEQPCAAEYETRHADLPSASCQHNCGMMESHDADLQKATHHRQQPHNDAVSHDGLKHRQCSQGVSSFPAPWPSNGQMPHDHQIRHVTERTMQHQLSTAEQQSPSRAGTPNTQGNYTQKQQGTRQGQHQEWEWGGSTPDLEQLTGGLFSDEHLEEVCAHHNLLMSVPMVHTAKPQDMLL